MPNLDNAQETRAYELIINAFAAGSKVQVTKEHVYIYSDTLSVQTVEHILAKPGYFKNLVGQYIFIPTNYEEGFDSSFSLQGADSTQTLISRSEIPKLPFNFLKALFGDTILKELNLHNINPEHLTEIEGNLIYPIENYKMTEQLWNARVKMLKMVLQSTGTAGLEAVFSSGAPLELNSGDFLDSALTKNGEDIIGIKVNEHIDNTRTAFFYLNKRYLTDLIFAPEVIHTESNTIRIDKKQFSDYLARVFGNVIVPRQELHGEHNQALSFVTPVIIPVAISNSLNKQNIYTLVIDVSTSLRHVEVQYKEQLTSIVDKLVMVIRDSSAGYVNPQDLIRLVFFSNEFNYIDFTVAEALKNVETLKQAIMAVSIEGGTLLDGTITIQIDELARLCSKETCNANMLIFTDGVDNLSSFKQKQSLQDHGDLFREQKTELIPKFHIFRVGDSDVSHIDAISKGIDAAIYDINDLGGLASLFAKIRDLNLHRDVIKFVQEEKQTLIPLYEGRLTVGPSLDISKKIQVKGKDYTMLPSPKQVANGWPLGHTPVICSYPEATAELLFHPSMTYGYQNDIKSLLDDIPSIVDINVQSCKSLTWQRNNAIVCRTNQAFDVVVTPTSDSYQVGFNKDNIDGNLALYFILGRITLNAASGLCKFMWQASFSSSSSLLPKQSGYSMDTCDVADDLKSPNKCRM
jgi:hypothetical protein